MSRTREAEGFHPLSIGAEICAKPAGLPRCGPALLRRFHPLSIGAEICAWAIGYYPTHPLPSFHPLSIGAEICAAGVEEPFLDYIVAV